MKLTTIKQIIIVLLILGALLSIYFGSYLPFYKAQKTISAINALHSGAIKSLEQFKALADDLFNFYSPIGQEETVRFFGREITNMMRNSQQQEIVMRELAKTTEPYYFKNNVRHLSNMGEMYSILWSRYRKEEDFQKTEFYLLKMSEIGPNLPPALYPLFDLYRAHGDVEKMKGVRDTILKFWPDEKRVL